MKVLKFGGTSIGSASHIKKVVNTIIEMKNNFVVFSAFSTVTNLLSEFIKQSNIQNNIISEQILELIKERHLTIICELILSKKFKMIAEKKLDKAIKSISKYSNKKISQPDENYILAQGELLSVMIIYIYMLEQGIDAALIPALNFMKTNKNNEPDYDFIEKKINKEIKKHLGCEIFITSGFICKNHKNKIDNLGRGASDYTATIIGKAIKASEVQIWTDINGLHNNDPRYVENTKPINYLSYDEASELAFFGAKILHPSSITPVQKANIPITIKNTMSPSDRGTVISEYSVKNGLKAIAAKDGITTINVKSGRMMQAYGFLRKIFEVFEKYQTSVDMLTTSEISVAMTIDNTYFLNEIKKDLSLLGDVEIIKNQSIICIVGDYDNDRNISIQNIINALDTVPIQMISFGSSKINISIAINTENKIEALNLLNNYILINQTCLVNKESDILSN